MAIPPPNIDQRSYLDFVEQTKHLAEAYTDWRSPPADQPDAGLALIRIFSRMATLVSDRLNRVSDRNLLAYINLIGAQLIPPQPARVPLTFHLAGGCPTDVLVPDHTQVAAPASEGDKEEVVFETEQALLVTGTQLKAMFVLEDRDYYSNRSDRLEPILANQMDAFLAFRGDRPVDHQLYLNCEEVFNLPDLGHATIILDTNSPESAIQLNARFQTWFYWSEKAWQPLPHVQTQVRDARITVTLEPLPKLMPVEVNGIKAKWLYVSLNPHQRENLPEITQITVRTSLDQTHRPKACLFNTIALNQGKDFYPFGLTPLPNDTFALELDSKLIKPGVAVEIRATLSQIPSSASDVTVVWEVGDGEHWQPIQVASEEDAAELETSFWSADLASLKFLEPDAVATLHFPAIPPKVDPTQDDAEPSYWIRVRIINGFYGNRGKERKYVVYNDVTLTARAIVAGQQEIIVDSIDEFSPEDTIRIQSSGGALQQEEARIVEKIEAEKKLILDHATRNAYEAGARILSKFTISENTPDTFTPPLIQTISVTYKFTLQRSSIYLAYNDFNYCHGEPFQTRLRHAAKSGDWTVQLEEVNQLAIGEFLRFEEGHPEQRQIELIDLEHQQVIFTEPLTADHPRAGRVSRAFHPLTPAINQHSALYLGFNKPFSNRSNSLFLQVEPPAPDEVSPNTHAITRVANLQRVMWEYASPHGWQPLIVQDETQALEESGLVQFIGPTDFIPVPYFGQSLYWLRIRKQPNDWGSIPFALLYFFKWTIEFRQVYLYGFMRYLLTQISRSSDFWVPPRLRSVRTNTVWASQTITLDNEVLGSSNGDLNQTFITTHAPILLNQQLEVQEGRLPSEAEQRLLRQTLGSDALTLKFDESGLLETVWVRWQEVPDFFSSTADDRHYVVDRQAGVIQFGDGQAGRIPPRGRNNIRLIRYQTGGGNRGNRGTQTIAELKTTIPYIDRVINWEAAKGGNDQELLERLQERAPQWLRHRDRAVTAQDFEDLTYEASAEVARVKVITPEMIVPDYSPFLEELWIEPGDPDPAHRPVAGNEIQVMQHGVRAGRVQVIIVPYSDVAQPTPSLSLLNRVETFLRSRFVPTMELRVTGCKWQEIRVITEIVPTTVSNADAIRQAAEQRIQTFLHPLVGGDRGMGWSFGRKPHRSDLYAILEAVPGVRYVRSLEIQPADVEVDQQTLIYSGQHQVSLRFLEASD